MPPKLSDVIDTGTKKMDFWEQSKQVLDWFMGKNIQNHCTL
jgi:hypothetical protein